MQLVGRRGQTFFVSFRNPIFGITGRVIIYCHTVSARNQRLRRILRILSQRYTFRLAIPNSSVLPSTLKYMHNSYINSTGSNTINNILNINKNNSDTSSILIYGGNWSLDLSRPALQYRRAGATNNKFFFPTAKLEQLESLPFLTKTIGRVRSARRGMFYLLNSCYVAKKVGREDGFCFITSKLMKRICGDGRNWSNLWKLLVANGVIECDKTWKRGEKCLGFRLPDDWEAKACLWKQVPFPNFPTYENDLPKITGLGIETIPALNTLDRLYTVRKIFGKWDSKNGKRVFWDENTYSIFRRMILNFDNGFSVRPERCGGRLFTMANQLPKAIRKHLTFWGARTIELDVKCCQPLLLITIYKAKSTEYFKYKNLVENGDLYGEAAAAIAPDLSRNEFKNKYFLPWLFGQSEINNSYKLRIDDWFSTEFPELFARIQDYLKFGSKKLPRTLQRREASMIWRALNEAGIPHVSIHDGCRCLLQDETNARRVIKDAFWTTYQLRPQIEIADVWKEMVDYEKVAQASAA